jgi:UDP-N-acetylmuramoyl-tripeptide--D-alanyl-D-alanine ligase
MLASLQLLKDHPGQRKIAILGTMKELGTYGPSLHYQVGKKVQELGIDCLLVLANDPEAEEIAKGAMGVYTQIYPNHKDLLNNLMEFVMSGDVLLFKASHSVGLNQVVQDFQKLYEGANGG